MARKFLVIGLLYTRSPWKVKVSTFNVTPFIIRQMKNLYLLPSTTLTDKCISKIECSCGTCRKRHKSYVWLPTQFLCNGMALVAQIDELSYGWQRRQGTPSSLMVFVSAELYFPWALISASEFSSICTIFLSHLINVATSALPYFLPRELTSGP